MVINNDQMFDAETDPEMVSNIFNDYFVNVGKKLADNFSNEVNNENLIVNNTFCFDKCFLEKIESAEVLKIVNSSRDDTAAGYDRITTNLLKHILELIIDLLVYIFYNLSIKQSVFPDNLMVAVIKPLLKGGDSKCINNYRPISLLISFSKILEKIIKVRLITFLENNKLLSKNQYGFRPGIGTEDALYSTTQFL